MKAIRFLTLGAALVMLTVTAGCEKSRPSTQSTMSVPAASSALVNAIAACNQQADDCVMQAQGDMTALQACTDQRNTCRDATRAATLDPLVAAIHACTNASQQCMKAAADESARAACHDQLASCLGDARPDHLDDADGGDDGDRANHSQSPVDACIDAMRVCVEADGDARACAMQMHACVVASVPAASNGGGSGGHGGSDASTPRADAGKSGEPHGAPADAGKAGEQHEPADAGKAGEQHGPATDAGTPNKQPSMACLEKRDACLAAGGSAQDCAKQLRDCSQMP